MKMTPVAIGGALALGIVVYLMMKKSATTIAAATAPQAGTTAALNAAGGAISSIADAFSGPMGYRQGRPYYR